MKATDFKLIKYEADTGKVFDWKEPRYTEIDGEEVQEHLYAKVLYIGAFDDINNYIEVEEVNN